MDSFDKIASLLTVFICVFILIIVIVGKSCEVYSECNSTCKQLTDEVNVVECVKACNEMR